MENNNLWSLTDDAIVNTGHIVNLIYESEHLCDRMMNKIHSIRCQYDPLALYEINICLSRLKEIPHLMIENEAKIKELIIRIERQLRTNKKGENHD